MIVMACTFNTGWLLVANIGCGAGVTTFFLLSLFLGVETKRAMPTAIVIGAWAQMVPLGMNFFFLGNMDPMSIPYVRLMMMVPGIWFGSLLAPWFSRCGGPMCDLFLYFVFLLGIGTFVVVFGAMAIDTDQEDVDINIKPMFAIPEIDEIHDTYFGLGLPTSSPVLAPKSSAPEPAPAPAPKPAPKPADPKAEAGGGGAKKGGSPAATTPRELAADMATQLGTRALEYIFDVDFSAGATLEE
jgi:hypothetical protein